MDGPSRLKAWREAQGLSQAQVAEALRALGAGRTAAASVCEWEATDPTAKRPRMDTAVELQRLSHGAVPTTAWEYPAVVLPDSGEHPVPADDSAQVPGERPSPTGTGD